MRRFGLSLDDHTYNEFYRLFPDHGHRTSILRRCVYRIVSRAKASGGVLPKDIEDIVNGVIKEGTA